MFLLELNLTDVKNIKENGQLYIHDYVTMINEKITALGTLSDLLKDSPESLLENERDVMSWLVRDIIDSIKLDVELYDYVINNKNELPKSTEEFKQILLDKRLSSRNKIYES
ncbi:hypothetical protein RJG79_08260 [Mycoplasmatota bacterium WC44]